MGSLESANKAFDLHTFTKALVAALVTQDIEVVRPHDPKDRRGFAAVLDTLDMWVEKLIAQSVPSQNVLPLLEVANELRPSNTGGYEGFESALRSLQLTFTASPNPWYDDIAFRVSRVQALGFLEHVPEMERSIAQEAAKAFIASRSRTDN